MRFLTPALIVLASVAALAQQTVFRASSAIVSLPAMVLDAEGRLAPSLTQDDFSIFDNGKPQTISLFRDTSEPFTAVLILDFSASMTGNLKILKSAAEEFLIRMLPQDKAQVGAFSDKIQFSGTFTSDRDDLITALTDLQYGNETKLWDAVDASIDLLEGASGRKVVIVLTDGDDYASRKSFGSVLSRAKANDILVYAIYLEGSVLKQRTRPGRSLKKIAEETGSGYFELKKTDALGPTFTRVAQELHSLYTIGFTPEALDGKEHKLEVRMKQPGMTARTRKTYVASPSVDSNR